MSARLRRVAQCILDAAEDYFARRNWAAAVFWTLVLKDRLGLNYER